MKYLQANTWCETERGQGINNTATSNCQATALLMCRPAKYTGFISILVMRIVHFILNQTKNEALLEPLAD